MNIFLCLAIIYFSGVIANVLVIKISNKVSPNTFFHKDAYLVWLSWFSWLIAFFGVVGYVFEWLNDKFINWVFK